MNEPTLVIGTPEGMKSIPISRLPPEAWQTFLGRPPDSDRAENVIARYKDIPWLYRGVNARANAMVAIPRTLNNGDSTDTEQSVSDVYPFLADFDTYIEMMTRWYVLYGQTYAYIQRNLLGGIMGFTPMHPLYVRPVWSGQDGTLLGFDRYVKGKPKQRLELEEVFYWWKSPDETDLGWGVSDAAVALRAAGVLYYTDLHASRLFASGAINPTIISLHSDTQDKDRERVESWFQRMLGGVRKAYGIVAVRGEFKATTIGQDLDKLSVPLLTRTKREDIATALGVPQSLMFAGAANYATARQDKLNWYEDTIKPDDRLLTSRLNTQVFTSLGYKLESHFERMEIYQESETEKSAGLVSLVQAGIIDRDEARTELEYEPRVNEEGQTIDGQEDMATDQPQIYAYHIDSGTVTRNEVRERLGFPALDDTGEERLRNMQTQLNLIQQAVNTGIPLEIAVSMAGLDITLPEKQSTSEQDSDSKAVQNEIRLWQKVAVRRFKEGHLHKAQDFKTSVLSPSIVGAITGALKVATSIEDIERIFSHVISFPAYP